MKVGRTYVKKITDEVYEAMWENKQCVSQCVMSIQTDSDYQNILITVKDGQYVAYTGYGDKIHDKIVGCYTGDIEDLNEFINSLLPVYTDYDEKVLIFTPSAYFFNKN